MTNLRDLIQIQTNQGEPLTVGDITLTPQSRALIIRWPHGGFVWNRPIGVIVDRAGQTERQPIVDVTRYATELLAGLTLLFSVIIIVAARQRRSKTHE